MRPGDFVFVPGLFIDGNNAAAGRGLTENTEEVLIGFADAADNPRFVGIVSRSFFTNLGAAR